MSKKKMIQVKNRKTGVVSPMTQEQWDKIKKDPEWAYVFTEVKGEAISVPAEVADLEAQKSNPDQGGEESSKEGGEDQESGESSDSESKSNQSKKNDEKDQGGDDSKK